MENYPLVTPFKDNSLAKRNPVYYLFPQKLTKWMYFLFKNRLIIPPFRNDQLFFFLLLYALNIFHLIIITILFTFCYCSFTHLTQLLLANPFQL